ncbi:putative pectinesterase 63 [Juglans microcarpa x Juglans regia]|uniref:putative pectinesterase 63 n=1 Tax=Juglans microcarpa x Juglans regia TaxID=2249226 RepID=UPI001B7E2969|nr:putative pectinesterase 63 [Juglans microcarpa x Juglans regia]
MALKLRNLATQLLFLATLLVLQLVPTALCHANQTVASDPESNLDAWIALNMKEYEEASKHTLFNNALIASLSKASRKIIKVRKDGAGDFKTVTDAVESIPSGNTDRVIIYIAGGTYKEKVVVDRSKPFVTFYGQPGNMPTITYDGTAKKYGTWKSATVAIESDNFMAVNIIFVNSSPKPDPRKSDGQAVALRISGDMAAFYSCRFIGFQDTLCDDRGRHLFQSCYIEGSVDFIFGNGKSLYRDTTIKSVAEKLGVIAAQDMNGKSGDSGFVFVHCKIQGTGDMYLGRAWKETSRVVFAYTYMGSNINSGGWMKSQHQKNVFYGEYQCSGPGSSASNRKFGKTLSDDQVKPFLSTTFIGGNQWLVPVPKIA